MATQDDLQIQFSAEPSESTKLLIVDDEESIRAYTTIFLEQKDYSILEADSGEAALNLLDKEKNGIRLVLLDLSMPGIGGFKTLSLIKEKYPDLPVVLATGYSEDERVIGLLEKGASGLLTKPYSGEELVQIIAKALDKS